MFKLALISAFFLFVVATLISLLLPSQVLVSRPIDIVASADSVHAYLSDVNNWKDWLETGDSSTSSVTTDGKKNIQYRNTAISIGTVTNDRIETVWKVGDGKPMQGQFNFITQSGSSYFTLQWSFAYNVKWYPWEKFASILSDKALGPFMQRSLENLKSQVEAPQR